MTQINKVLAAMQDLQTKPGAISQNRGGTTVEVNGIDVPFAVSSITEMQDLNVEQFVHARVYSSATSYADYLYDSDRTTGIPSATGVGSWFLVGNATQTISLRDAYSLSDGDNITSALLDAFKRYSAITIDGLKDVVINSNVDLSADRVCSQLIIASEITVLGSKLTFAASGDMLEMNIHVQSGWLGGDAKHAEVVAQVEQNATSIEVSKSDKYGNPHGLVAGDRAASSFDNATMPNASDGGRVVNIIANIIDNGTTNSLMLTNPVLVQPTDGPIPVGAYITTADFTRTGLTYYGQGDFCVSANSVIERPFRNFAGYIITGEDLANPRGSRKGTLSLLGFDFTDSYLDCFRFSKEHLVVDKTKNTNTLEPGKQCAIVDPSVSTVALITGNRWARINQDTEFTFFDTTGAGDIVEGGTWLLKGNTFDGDVSSLPYAGDTVWGRSKLKFNRGAFHVMQPFYQAGVRNISWVSEGNKYLNYSRAVFGTSFVDKDEFSMGKVSFTSDYSDADLFYVDVNGVSTNDLSLQNNFTATNCTIYGSAFRLNNGCSMTYVNCAIGTDQDLLDANQLSTIEITHSTFQGGELIEGSRFRVGSGFTRFSQFSLPYTQAGAATFFISTAYTDNVGVSFILEQVDVNAVDSNSYFDVNRYYVVNPYTPGRPGIPQFNMQLGRTGIGMKHGARDFDQGNARPVLSTERVGYPPFSIVGTQFHRLISGAEVTTASDDAVMVNVNTARATIGTAIEGATAAVSSFPVTSAVPYGYTHIGVIKRDVEGNAQNDRVMFYRLDKSSWNTNTVNILASLVSSEIDYDVAGTELIAYYRFINKAAAGLSSLYYMEASTSASPDARGAWYVAEQAGTATLVVPSSLEDGFTGAIINYGSGGVEIVPPAGWLVAGGTVADEQLTWVVDQTNDVMIIRGI